MGMDVYARLLDMTDKDIRTTVSTEHLVAQFAAAADRRLDLGHTKGKALGLPFWFNPCTGGGSY